MSLGGPLPLQAEMGRRPQPLVKAESEGVEPELLTESSAKDSAGHGESLSCKNMGRQIWIMPSHTLWGKKTDPLCEEPYRVVPVRISLRVLKLKPIMGAAVMAGLKAIAEMSESRRLPAGGVDQRARRISNLAGASLL